MSMNPDEMKRKMAADALKKEGEEKKQAERKEADLEEQQRKMKAELTNRKRKIEKESEAQFAPLQGAYQKDWKLIVDDYTKQFKREPDQDGKLIFPTKDEAISFFKAQAESKRKFCVVESVNGKVVDFYLLSCGDGQLYKGTSAEVRAQLEQEIRANPSNQDAIDGLALLKSLVPAAPTPAVDMRNALKDGRATDNSKAATAQTAPTPTPTPGATGSAKS